MIRELKRCHVENREALCELIRFGVEGASVNGRVLAVNLVGVGVDTTDGNNLATANGITGVAVPWKLRRIIHLDPVEGGKGEYKDLVVRHCLRAKVAVPASVQETEYMWSVKGRRRNENGTHISYVLLVEFTPAVQNSILGSGVLPVVVWLNHFALLGS